MPDLFYDPDAVEQARVAVAAQARRVPALCDDVASVPAGAFGALAGAGELTEALGRLREALRSDLAAAGRRLADLDRALDVSMRSMQAVDGGSAASLGAAGGGR